MSCCPEHKEKDKNKKVVAEKEPKSLIGKWLYKIGKSDNAKEKNGHEGCH